MWFMIAVALLYGPYNAKVVNVIDAETLWLKVAVWPGEDRTMKIGVLGVDTPSLNGKCDAEKLMAKEALEMTRAFVGDLVRLNDVRKSKTNGKFYARVRNRRGKLLSEALIEAGYGVPYRKGEKVNWCP